MILDFFFIQTFLKHCKALSTEKYKRYINILLLFLLLLNILLFFIIIILSTMHSRSQHCWEMLHPFADYCLHARNNSQHCWRNNVGNCCVRLHTTSEPIWTRGINVLTLIHLLISFVAYEGVFLSIFFELRCSAKAFAQSPF